jgi:4-amino-4-deoxy-L-arabinose transferase-like glycosyltransferase
MRTFERNLLVVILLISAILSVSLLTRGHLWWDDFASYIMQAQSLLNGSPRAFVEHNTFTINTSSYPQGPVAYPWGFPLLLAPVLSLFGLKVLALKLVNTFFYLCFLIAFYALARRRLSSGSSLALTAILAFNPALLLAHDLILSDISFLFFSTLSIFLIDAATANPSPKTAALTGVAIFAATLLRTNGVLLLVPLAIAQLMRLRGQSGRGWLVIVLPYFVFGGLYLLQSQLLPDGQDSYLSHFSLFTFPRFMRNLRYYLRLPAEFFSDIPLGLAFALVAAALFLADAAANFRRTLVILSYVVVTLALFIAWPETQGLRFIYPILPLLLLLAGEGFQLAASRLPDRFAAYAGWAGSLMAVALIVLSLGVSTSIGWANLINGRALNGPFDQISSGMFEFVREKTPPDSVIIFFRPRLMRLLTARDAYMAQSCNNLNAGDYLVMHEKQGTNGQIGDVSICAGRDFPVVFNNKRFTIYKLSPP